MKIKQLKYHLKILNLLKLHGKSTIKIKIKFEIKIIIENKNLPFDFI